MSWIVIVLPVRGTQNADVGSTIPHRNKVCTCLCVRASVSLAYGTSQLRRLHSRAHVRRGRSCVRLRPYSNQNRNNFEGVTVRLLVTITTFERIHVRITSALTFRLRAADGDACTMTTLTYTHRTRVCFFVSHAYLLFAANRTSCERPSNMCNMCNMCIAE